jgi:hypothetical protein
MTGLVSLKRFLRIASCPALCRASTSWWHRKEVVDGRDKPGRDVLDSIARPPRLVIIRQVPFELTHKVEKALRSPACDERLQRSSYRRLLGVLAAHCRHSIRAMFTFESHQQYLFALNGVLFFRHRRAAPQ